MFHKLTVTATYLILYMKKIFIMIRFKLAIWFNSLFGLMARDLHLETKGSRLGLGC